MIKTWCKVSIILILVEVFSNMQGIASTSPADSEPTSLPRTPFVMRGSLNDHAIMSDGVLDVRFQPDGLYWVQVHYYPRTGEFLRYYNGRLRSKLSGPTGDWSSDYCANITTYVLMPLKRIMSAKDWIAEPDPQVASDFVRLLGQTRDAKCLNKPLDAVSFVGQCDMDGEPTSGGTNMAFDGKTFSYRKQLSSFRSSQGYCRNTTIDVTSREVKTTSCDPVRPETVTGCEAVATLIQDMRSYGCLPAFDAPNHFIEFRRWMLMNLAESCQISHSILYEIRDGELSAQAMLQGFPALFGSP